MFEATQHSQSNVPGESFDPKIREMIILRAAKVLNAPYEAQANGLSAAEIDAAATESSTWY